MTSPYARADYAPNEARVRAQPTPRRALTGARIARTLRRQVGLFLLIAALITITGVVVERSSGTRWQDSVALWGWVGLGVALLVALLRESGRNTITSIQSLGRHRGYSVLGAAPAIGGEVLRQLPPDARTPHGVLTLQPSSSFAAAFRDLQQAIADDAIVAFIAPGPDEGASTSALCAALAAMQQGRRVILLDCDIRRRSVTRALNREPTVGVLEAAERPDAWRSFVDHEDETGLPFIPASHESNPWRSLFGAPGFPALLEHLRAEFDLIVLDCPPALGAAEGVMLARLADRCVVVTAWDETPLAAVRNTMKALRKRSRATTGIYVNRVPPGYRFGRVRPD